MLIKIKDNKGFERVVGDIRNGMFFRRVFEQKHLFKQMDAWGIDEDVFNIYIKNTNTGIIFFDEDKKVIYTCNPSDFLTYGEKKQFKNFRPQIFLKRKYWHTQILNFT